MGFSLAESTRRKAEDSVTQQAIKTWQARAQQAAQGLGFSAWKPGHVTVQTARRRPRLPDGARTGGAGSPGGAPVAMEAGTTDVTVTVSGDAVLQ